MLCSFCQIIICLSELICAGAWITALYGADASLRQDSKEEYMAGVALLRQSLAVGYQMLVSHDPAGGSGADFV